jgi:hypothetical protein
MRLHGTFILLTSLALLSGCAQSKVRDVTDPSAERSIPERGPVAVNWTDPAQFSEIRFTRDRFDATRGDWVRKLALHLQKRAGRQLPDGERMEVQITDIDLAGEYEPERTFNFNSARVLRDIYPPRIELKFTRFDEQGQVIAEGERKLRDLSYLHNIPLANRNDSLRYEKRLLDDWLRKELRETM